jgi:hypothetical protein
MTMKMPGSSFFDLTSILTFTFWILVGILVIVVFGAPEKLEMH